MTVYDVNDFRLFIALEDEDDSSLMLSYFSNNDVNDLNFCFEKRINKK